MALKTDMAFPRYIDRPGLFLMFELDEVLYSLGVSSIFAMFILFSTASVFLMLLTYVILVPLVKAVVAETKKQSGLPGALQYIRYASGYISAFPMKKEQMVIRWPELKRIDTFKFVPYGFEDEFLS